MVQCVPRHLFISLEVSQLYQPCKDLHDPNDKEAIRAVSSLCSRNLSCWQKVANSQILSLPTYIDQIKHLDIVFPITKAIVSVPVSETVSVCVYSHRRPFLFFSLQTASTRVYLTITKQKLIISLLLKR